MPVYIEKLEARRIFSATLAAAGEDGILPVEPAAGVEVVAAAEDFGTAGPFDSIELARFPAVEWVDEYNRHSAYQAWIDWGDGREHRGYVSIDEGEVVVEGISCYPEAGTYTVTVTLDVVSEDQSMRMTHTTTVPSDGMISHAVPRVTKTIGDRTIAELEWQGRTIEMVAGEWIVGLSRDLPGLTGPYIGWDTDYPGYSNYWQVLLPEMKQRLDATGLAYEWRGFLGDHDVFALKVDPSTTHAQLHAALKDVPGYFSVEPNGIGYITGSITPVEAPVVVDPVDDEIAPEGERDRATVMPPAADAPLVAPARARVARELFAPEAIFDEPEALLG